MIIPQNMLLYLIEENWAVAESDKEFENQKGQAIEHSIIQLTGGGSPFKYSRWDMKFDIGGQSFFCEVKSTSTSWTKVSDGEILHAQEALARGIDTIFLSFLQMLPRDEFKFIGSVLYSQVKELFQESKFPTKTGGTLHIISNTLIRQNHVDIDLPTGQPTPTLVLQYTYSPKPQ